MFFVQANATGRIVVLRHDSRLGPVESQVAYCHLLAALRSSCGENPPAEGKVAHPPTLWSRYRRLPFLGKIRNDVLSFQTKAKSFDMS